MLLVRKQLQVDSSGGGDAKPTTSRTMHFVDVVPTSFTTTRASRARQNEASILLPPPAPPDQIGSSSRAPYLCLLVHQGCIYCFESLCPFLFSQFCVEMRTRVDDDDDDSYDSNSLLSSSSSEGSSSLPAAQNPWKKHHQSHSSSKPRRGLSKTLQRQLLNDIERNGGILNVSLQALCNKKADIYGSSNSLLRRAVQNKVSRWKKLTKHHYNLVCLELIGTNGTQQESNRKSAETPPPQTNKVTTNRKLVFESPPPFFASPTNMNNTNKTAMTYIDRVIKERNFGKF